MSVCLVALIPFEPRLTREVTSMLNRLSIDYRIVLPNEVPKFIPTHVIIAGGSQSAGGIERVEGQSEELKIPQWVLNRKMPVLGIGSGMVMIARLFQGCICKLPNPQKGLVEITEINDGYHISNNRWLNRDERVISLPSGFQVIGVTSEGDIASFVANRWWGVQYHPEKSRYKDIGIFRRFFAQTQV